MPPFHMLDGEMEGAHHAEQEFIRRQILQATSPNREPIHQQMMRVRATPRKPPGAR